MKRVCIVGAGVVGLATARAIQRTFPSYHITVLDKNLSPCAEASRYNSGVVHSGIHLHPDSLKSRFARVGSKLLILYCNTHNIPFRRVGMIVGIGFKNLRTLFKNWRVSFRVLWELRKRAK